VDGKAGPFEFITYEETAALVEAIASALTAAGVKAKDKCSIYGGNCTEWMIAMQVLAPSWVMPCLRSFCRVDDGDAGAGKCTSPMPCSRVFVAEWVIAMQALAPA
jgi:acyl-CoA synthetase (AMP-forming)/AMP-acid ligase II